MQRNLLIEYFLLLCIALNINSQSYYTIEAPGWIKPNHNYSVVASLHEAPEPCSLRVGIEGPNFREFKDVDLQPFESKVIHFSLKHLDYGKYIFKAEGLTGLIFKNQSSLTLRAFNPVNVYMQTDKGIYKPGDLVRFRFVILDEHTRPLNIKDPVHVEIIDPQRNRVKQFKNISLTHGSFTGEFQLAKYSPLTLWQIDVLIDGTYNFVSSKYFEVNNYILPKFSVNLKTPSDVVLEDGLIKVAVYGKYTFEKYVEGNATIQLLNDKEYMVLQSQQVDIQNLGYVDFNLTAIKDIHKYDRLVIVAHLSEKYTGKTEVQIQHVNIHKQRYSLSIPNEEIEFENNIPYIIKANVKHFTGAPVLDKKTPVTMQHGGKIYEAFLDSNGSAAFEFDYDANDKYNFHFKDSQTTFPYIVTNENLPLSNREYYCRLQLVDKKLKLGKPVLIEVSSIVKIPYLMYLVMGHSNIVRSEYIKVPDNQKSYTISITPSIEMLPKSFIYVYYVHKGNLRFEEMTLEFPAEFENQISLTAPQQATAGEEVTITMNAQPKSYVSILAVDLGVYLLKDTYDLIKETILYDMALDRSYSPEAGELYPGIISGLLTLTNAHYPYQLPKQGGGGGGSGGFGGGGSSGHEGGGALPSVRRFRQKFPETWIFNNYLINDTQTNITFQIPDSITTWRITAFSTNAELGFGIVDSATNIVTSQDFFISINLPYSVKRGEVLILAVTVFNYSNQTLDTKVILDNKDNEFNFMQSNKQNVEMSNGELRQVKQISIAADRGKTVKFLIQPIKVGEVTIEVTAANSLYWDGVLEKLKVEPDGVPKQENQASYISIPGGEKISYSFQLSEPVDSVPDSEYITFSVGGHYLVPTVENFEDLTQMPTGSGEQNMVNFAPSVLILQYLKLNGKLEKEKDLVEKLKMSLEISYQEQLAFRHYNGGYSVFGYITDRQPSTWLTAYVVRYFIKASEFVDIDEEVVQSGLEYLVSQQKPNGEFSFTGYLLNPNHQNEYGLSAFILLAFMEDQKYANIYQETIEKGLQFLSSSSDNINDINALCLITAVIKQAKLPNADILVDQLKSHGKESNGLRWWSTNDENPAKDIELTANAAQTLLDTPGDHTDILKWLLQQRNANGGFITCDDTVAGMEALVKFSEKYTNLKDVNLKVSYSAKDALGNEVARDEFYVDSNNVLSFQKHELPTNTRHITFEMEGQGASLVQLNQQYNVDNVHEFHHFNLDVRPMLKNANEYLLGLCFTYLSYADPSNNSTNMVILEINLPSGYQSDEENNMALKENSLIKRVEMKNSDTVVVLYLDKLMADMKYCLDILIAKTSEVLMAKPAAVVIYDYYNVSRSNTEFYSV